CAADAIYVKLRTNRTFEGHVHVKFASNKYCYQDNCLIVRSCSVVAAEKAHELIGADGCSKNTKILPHLSYFGPSLVGQNVSVFGVSQTSLIYFECELLLIPKQKGVCDVPTCAESDGNRTRRSFDDHPSISVDVQSQRIEVSELGVISDVEVDSMQSVELTCHEKASYPEICVSFNPFFVFLAGMISVTFFVISTAAMVSFQRYRDYSMSQTRC
ncbi:hypothetical protein NECAME_04144, partial [Necator americanus]